MGPDGVSHLLQVSGGRVELVRAIEVECLGDERVMVAGHFGQAHPTEGPGVAGRLLLRRGRLLGHHDRTDRTAIPKEIQAQRLAAAASRTRIKPVSRVGSWL